MLNKLYKKITIPYWLISVGVLIVLLISPKYNNMNSLERSNFLLEGEDIKALLLVDGSLKSKGYALGYLYHILPIFGESKHCNIEAIPAYNNEYAAWEGLINKELDMVIINAVNDTIPPAFKDYIVSSVPLNINNDICVVAKDNFKIIESINHWLFFFKQSADYINLNRNYFRSYKVASDAISPYDSYIKEYAKILNWDWRLLASLIYRESQFKLGLISTKGAVGLMQIKESVANEYGIKAIFNPKENILAGVKHLERLQKMYKNMGADSLNVIKLTLASYNCGEGRLEDCIRLAANNNLDSLNWDNIVSLIPKMAEEEVYTQDYIKLGKFKGNETIDYVEYILERYSQYCQAGVAQ